MLTLFFQSIVLAGLYSAIPYALLATMVAISGQVADFLRAKCLSTTVVRKIMTITGESVARGLSLGMHERTHTYTHSIYRCRRLPPNLWLLWQHFCYLCSLPHSGCWLIGYSSCWFQHQSFGYSTSVCWCADGPDKLCCYYPWHCRAYRGQSSYT